MDMALNKVKVRDDWNVRSEEESEVESLAESMNRYGQIHPIVVNDKDEILAGHRRFFAAQKLGWYDIAVVVKSDLTHTEQRMIHLDENLERRDLSIPRREQALAEKASIYRELVDSGEKGPGDFRKDTEQQTGLSKTAIYRGVARHDNASEKTWDAYTKEQIGSIQLDEMIKLPKPVQNKILKKVTNATIPETRVIVNEELAKINVPKDYAVLHPELGTIHVEKFIKLFVTGSERMLDLLDCFETCDIKNMISFDEWQNLQAFITDVKNGIKTV